MTLRRVALALLLGGCSDPAVPSTQMPMPPSFAYSNPIAFPQPPGFANIMNRAPVGGIATPPPRPPIDLSRYWQGFNDPQLDRLVATAVTQNYSMAAARDRIIAAAATGGGAAAGLWPSVTATGTGQESVFSSIGKPLQGGGTLQRTGFASLDAIWPLPLFGRFTATRNGAAALLRLATAQRQATQVGVVAQVASAYIALRADQQQQTSLQTELASARHIVDLVQVQAGAGIASTLDVARAQNHVDELALKLPGTELAIATDLLRLAALQGQMAPDAGLLTAQPLPAAPAPPELVPADLLRLRPQIIEAEAAVASNAANLGIANADLYPQFTLGGSLSLFSGASILDPLTYTKLPNTLTLFEGGPGLTIPLLDWGQRRDRARGARAGLDASIADYHEAVADGVIDVDIALEGITAAHEEMLAAGREQESAVNALNLAQILFSHGLTNLSDLLNVEQQREKADMDATAAATAADNASINLYAAIGGGALPMAAP